MKRVPCLFLLLAVPSAARAERSAPGAGPPWPRLREGLELVQVISLDERQEVRHTAGPGEAPDAGIFTRLEGDVRWRVRRASEKEILLEGRIIEGNLEIEEKVLSKPAATHRFPVAGLRLKARLTHAGALVDIDPAGWAEARVVWLREVKSMHIGDERRDSAEAAAHRALREVIQLVLHFALPERAPRFAPIQIERALRRTDGKPSGTIVLSIHRSPENVSKDGSTLQGSFTMLHQVRRKRRAIPNLVRRDGFGPDVTDPGPIPMGEGTLLWKCGMDEAPFAWLSLEGRAPYFDPEELGAAGGSRVEYSFRLVCRAPDTKKAITRPPAESLPPLPDLPRAVAAAKDELSRTITRLWHDPEKALPAAEEYARLEEEGRLGLDVRAALHFALAEELALLAYRKERPEVRAAIEDWALKETRLPLFVLALRVLASPYASITDAERVAILTRVARRPEPELAAWGGKFLALVPWEGAVESLVQLLEEAAADPRRSRDLVRSLELDLFRVLGPKADGRWREMLADIERKREESRPYAFTHVPRKDPPGTIRSALLRRMTDGSSLRAVFVLDTSKSMTELLRWGRTEIRLALREFTPNVLFDIIHFHKTSVRWHGSLLSATASTIGAAYEHLDGLDNVRGSNLHTAAWALGPYEAVDVVIIVSDGGVPAQAEKEFLEWNYLRGARVITYGFSPSSPGRPGILEGLGRVHFGWYEQVVVSE